MHSPRNRPIWQRKTIPAPAAGQDFSISPDTAAHWLVRSIVATFTTGVNAGTRSAILTVDDGTTVYFRASPGGTQAASLTRLYGGHNGGSGAISQGSVVGWPLPTDGIWLPQGHRLRSAVENIDPADQWSAIAFLVIEYPTGPDSHFWPVPYQITEEAS